MKNKKDIVVLQYKVKKKLKIKHTRLFARWDGVLSTLKP